MASPVRAPILLPRRGRTAGSPGVLPALLLVNNFNGITPSGTTITTGNSGGVSGNAFETVNIGSGATVASSSTNAAHGSLAATISTGVTSTSAYVGWNTSVGIQPRLWFRGYYYFTANPAANLSIWRAFSRGTLAAGVLLLTTGQLRFVNTASATILTTSATVPLGQWFRIEGFVTGSATAGQVELKLFTIADSANPAETDTSAATQNTFGPLTELRWGVTGNTANVAAFWEDDIGLSNTGYLGPASLAGPASRGQPESPVAAQIPRSPRQRGRVATNTPSGAPVNNPTVGPVFRQATAPVRARLPQLHPRAGRAQGSAGAPVQNPGLFKWADGAISQATAGVSTISVTLPRPVGAGDLLVAITGAPSFAITDVSDTAGNQWQIGTGPTGFATLIYCASSNGAPGGITLTVAHTGAFGTRFLVADRFTHAPGAVVFEGATSAGATTTSGNAGSLTGDPGNRLLHGGGHTDTGSLQWQAGSSNGAGAALGETAGNSGGSGFSQYIVNTASGTQSLTWAASAFPAGSAQFFQAAFRLVPQAAPLAGPVRARVPQPDLHTGSGWIRSGAGAPVQNPTVGPPVYAPVGPVRARLPRLQPRAGRISSGPGNPVTNPVPAPVLHCPVRAKPPLPPRGRISSSPGAPVRNPGAGPLFQQATAPIRVRFPLLHPRAGRAAGNAGAPIANPTAGPVFRQATGPVRARIPQNWSKGRATGNIGAPVQNPAAAQFAQLHKAVRAQPAVFLKGRARGNPGTPPPPLPPPSVGPAFYPLNHPAGNAYRAPGPFRKGRARGNAGAPVLNPAPVLTPGIVTISATGTVTAITPSGGLAATVTAAPAVAGAAAVTIEPAGPLAATVMTAPAAPGGAMVTVGGRGGEPDLAAGQLASEVQAPAGPPAPLTIPAGALAPLPAAEQFTAEADGAPAH